MKPMVQAADFARNIRLQGNFEAAETAFKNGLLELFCGLAEVYLSSGNASYANRVLAQAEKIDPTARTRFNIREETFIERGKEYLSKKWHDGAEVEFKAALTLNESSIPALMGLGESLQGMGKSEAASETYQRAIDAKVMVEDRVLFNTLGNLALRNKNFNLALQAFDKAISYFPQDAVNYYNKSLLFVLQRNWEKVTPLLKKALSIQPGMREASMMMQKVEKWKKIPAAPQAAKAN
jgi:Tfp pilus assembly protein PilF